MAISYKRDYPRVETALAVAIRPPGGVTIHASTVNLSRAGFQIAADQESVDLLFPASHQPPPHDRVKASVELRLGHAGQQGPIAVDAPCVAVFARRTAQREFRVGFHFNELDEGTERQIVAFLDAL